MDIITLENEIERRTPEEQARLLAHLATLSLEREKAYLEELDRRSQASDGWLSLDKVKQMMGDDQAS